MAWPNQLAAKVRVGFMVMVWLEGGQGEVRGACAPPPQHPKSPYLEPPPTTPNCPTWTPPPNQPSRSPPPPLAPPILRPR